MHDHTDEMFQSDLWHSSKDDNYSLTNGKTSICSQLKQVFTDEMNGHNFRRMIETQRQWWWFLHILVTFNMYLLQRSLQLDPISYWFLIAVDLHCFINTSRAAHSEMFLAHVKRGHCSLFWGARIDTLSYCHSSLTSASESTAENSPNKMHHLSIFK